MDPSWPCWSCKAKSTFSCKLHTFPRWYALVTSRKVLEDRLCRPFGRARGLPVFRRQASLEDYERDSDKDSKPLPGRLPWRQSSPLIPNNRSLAESRLRLLRRRLLRDDNLHTKYNATMNEYLTKGYAVKIPPDELANDGKVVWYLPHHSVFHARKPEKVWVVFGCAAKYMGTSLNDQLLHGPDLNCPDAFLGRIRCCCFRHWIYVPPG